ncbi:CCN family member 5-like [Mercenaria mercenaria]|uniref:CCN family member 5-like n=1 Tax=Mercenaria mercenaria TaxID=6596 RepID=UPI00234F5B57|nr:CCN family member 5-like [Mercenaria mercenaria]
MKTLFMILFNIVFVATAAKRIDGETKRMLLASTACSDVLSDCSSYDPSVCTDDKYKQWATQNCAKTCHKCSSTSGGGTGNGGTISGSSAGCVYKSQIYQQGQTWRDGCKLSCHCLDGFSGQYTCNELCLIWDLPLQCHMQPPVAGKCCGKPYCPEGFTVNYPPGYVDQ